MQPFPPPHFPCPLSLFLASLVTFSGCLANPLLMLTSPPSPHEALLWPLCIHDPAGDPSLKNQHRENIKKGTLCLLEGYVLVSLSLQLCPSLCDPMGCSLPGSSVHGIVQARIGIATPSSRASS